MDFQESQPEPATVRISFTCGHPFLPNEVGALAGAIIGGLPVASDEVEIDPEGSGWIIYREDDGATLQELTDAVMWLRAHPRITDVSWQYVVDV
jgi:hypothetical protein